MTTDPRAAAKDIAEKVAKIQFKRDVSSPEVVGERIDSLVRTVSQEATKIARKNAESDQRQVNEELLQQNNVRELSQHLKQDLGQLQRAFDIAKNERAQLAKIEHGQGWRRVIWRAASTASVAAVILLTWYLAHKWGIPLPLMRAPSSIPVPTP